MTSDENDRKEYNMDDDDDDEDLPVIAIDNLRAIARPRRPPLSYEKKEPILPQPPQEEQHQRQTETESTSTRQEQRVSLLSKKEKKRAEQATNAFFLPARVERDAEQQQARVAPSQQQQQVTQPIGTTTTRENVVISQMNSKQPTESSNAGAETAEQLLVVGGLGETVKRSHVAVAKSFRSLIASGESLEQHVGEVPHAKGSADPSQRASPRAAVSKAALVPASNEPSVPHKSADPKKTTGGDSGKNKNANNATVGDVSDMDISECCSITEEVTEINPPTLPQHQELEQAQGAAAPEGENQASCAIVCDAPTETRNSNNLDGGSDMEISDNNDPEIQSAAKQQHAQPVAATRRPEEQLETYQENSKGAKKPNVLVEVSNPTREQQQLAVFTQTAPQQLEFRREETTRRSSGSSSADDSELEALNPPYNNHQGFSDGCPVVSSPGTTANSPHTVASEASFNHHNVPSKKSMEVERKERWPTSEEERKYFDQLEEEIHLAEEREYLNGIEADIVHAEEEQERLNLKNRRSEQERLAERHQKASSQRRLRVVQYLPRYLPGGSTEFLSRANIQDSADILQKKHPDEERPNVALRETPDRNTWQLEVLGRKSAVERVLKHVDLSLRNRCLSCARAELLSNGLTVDALISGSEKLGATVTEFRDIKDKERVVLLQGNPRGQLTGAIGQQAASYGVLLLRVNGEHCSSISDFKARIANSKDYQLRLRVSKKANLSVVNTGHLHHGPPLRSSPGHERGSSLTGSISRPIERCPAVTVPSRKTPIEARVSPSLQAGSTVTSKGTQGILPSSPGKVPVLANVERKFPVQRAVPNTSGTKTAPLTLQQMDDRMEVEVRVLRSEAVGATITKLPKPQSGCHLIMKGKAGSQFERLFGRKALISVAWVVSIEDKEIRDINDFKSAMRSARSERFRLKLWFPVDADLSGVDKLQVLSGPKRRQLRGSVKPVDSGAQSGASEGAASKKRKATETGSLLVSPPVSLAVPRKKPRGAPVGSLISELRQPNKKKADKKNPYIGSEVDPSALTVDYNVPPTVSTPLDNTLQSPKAVGRVGNNALCLQHTTSVNVVQSQRVEGAEDSSQPTSNSLSGVRVFENTLPNTAGTTMPLTLHPMDDRMEVEVRVLRSEAVGATITKLPKPQSGCHLIMMGKAGSQFERLFGRKALISVAWVVSIEDKEIRDINDFKSAMRSARSERFRLKLWFPVDADLSGVDKLQVLSGPKRRQLRGSVKPVDSGAQSGVSEGAASKEKNATEVDSLSVSPGSMAVPRKKPRDAPVGSLISELRQPDKKKSRGSEGDPSTTAVKAAVPSTMSTSLYKLVQSVAGVGSGEKAKGSSGRTDTVGDKVKPSPPQSSDVFETGTVRGITRKSSSLSADSSEGKRRFHGDRSKKRIRFAQKASVRCYSPFCPPSELLVSNVRKSDVSVVATNAVDRESCCQTYKSLAQVVQDPDGTPMDVISFLCRDDRKDTLTEPDLRKMREIVKQLSKSVTGAKERDYTMKDKLLKILISSMYYIRQARFTKNWERFDIRFEGIEELRVKDPRIISNGSRISGDVFGMQEGVDKLHSIPPAPLVFEETSSSYSVPFEKQEIAYRMNYNPILSDDRQMMVDLQLAGGNIPLQLGSIYVRMSQLHKECPPDKKWKHLVFQAEPTSALHGASLRLSACRTTMDRAVLEEKRSSLLKKVKEVLDWIKRWNQEYSSQPGVDTNGKLTADIKVAGNLTLLHAAVFLQDYRMVEKVLETGADPSAKSGAGSALSLARNMADGMTEELEEDGSGTNQEAGPNWKRSRRERMEKIVTLLREYTNQQ